MSKYCLKLDAGKTSGVKTTKPIEISSIGSVTSKEEEGGYNDSSADSEFDNDMFANFFVRFY